MSTKKHPYLLLLVNLVENNHRMNYSEIGYFKLTNIINYVNICGIHDTVQYHRIILIQKTELKNMVS